PLTPSVVRRSRTESRGPPCPGNRSPPPRGRGRGRGPGHRPTERDVQASGAEGWTPPEPACYRCPAFQGDSMLRANRAGLLAALLALSGCGVGVVDDGAGADVEDSQADLTIDFTYDCAGYGASVGQQLGLHLQGSKAYVSGPGFTAAGSRDTHYHPASS